MRQQKLQEIISRLIEQAANVNVECEFPLAPEKLALLKGLNAYCVSQVLYDPEVCRDPRKINYFANQELKLAVMAFCLSEALVNPQRRNRETKEFFAENITVYMRDEHTKIISFGALEHYKADAALYHEIIEDWKIYRDHEGLGIKALVDNKTNLAGLSDYMRGGDPVYEFARFHRKYTEQEHRRQEQNRQATEQAFRNGIVQSLAQEISKQQLLEGRNPMELIDMIFHKNIAEHTALPPQEKGLDPQVENQVQRLLEHSNNRER